MTGPSHDLELAAAAAKGDRAAQGALEREVFVPVRNRLARLHGGALADDAVQHVRAQLLTGDGLKAYAGTGPLRAWVMVIAARRLMALRGPAHESLGALADTPQSDRLELTLLRARYAQVFKASIARVLDGMARRERLLLKLHFVDGLSAEKIGAIFHIHRSTATEAIANAREALHARVVDEVQREAGLSPSELHSIGRVLQRQTDFSLPRLLAARDVEARSP
ncbi:MAG: hypothetical protein JNK82_28000 [Myxococcaceae bacterium]|nr:hypothetical protein [Myxococcaceae bacterium]